MPNNSTSKTVVLLITSKSVIITVERVLCQAATDLQTGIRARTGCMYHHRGRLRPQEAAVMLVPSGVEHVGIKSYRWSTEAPSSRPDFCRYSENVDSIT